MSFRGDIPLLPQHPLHQRLSCLCVLSSAYLGVTCLCPIIPMFPASPLPFSVSDPPLLPSLVPATPAVLLSPPHPFCCQNRFYCDLQLLLHCCLPPPHHMKSPPSLITCISCTMSKIVCRATHSITVACLLSTYFRSGCVLAPWKTIFHHPPPQPILKPLLLFPCDLPQ